MITGTVFTSLSLCTELQVVKRLDGERSGIGRLPITRWQGGMELLMPANHSAPDCFVPALTEQSGCTVREHREKCCADNGGQPIRVVLLRV